MAEDKNNEVVEELDFFTMVDEDGNSENFEFLGEVEYDDKTYIAVLPAEEAEDGEVIFLEVEESDDGESYVTIEDDDLLDTIYDIFKEENSDLYDFE